MEVVCLILGPVLASQPCLHAFWDLTSLIFPFIENVFFYYSCIFFLNGVNIFCRLPKYSYIIIMESYNHNHIH